MSDDPDVLFERTQRYLVECTMCKSLYVVDATRLHFDPQHFSEGSPLPATFTYCSTCEKAQLIRIVQRT